MKPTFDYSSVFKIRSHGFVSLAVSGMISSITAITILSSSAFAAPANNALPTGGGIASGNVNISQATSNTMNINQSSGKSIINWNTYNIGKDATVNYNFAQSGSSSLNRVNSNNPSEIFGHLNANGQVILVNPNGILFGAGSSVNVGSLVATTMNIKDADYQNGNMTFTRDANLGTIRNEGALTAEDKGYIALLSPTVVNTGVIKAAMGTVSLAAGDKIALSLDGSGLKTIIVEPSTIQTLIDNKSLISASGGVVYLGAKQAQSLLDGVMNLTNSGIIEANTMNNTNGKVTLDGDNIEVSGTIQAKGGEVRAGNANNNLTVIKGTATLEAEFVETSGHKLKVEDGIKIKAKSWLIDPTDITIESTGSTSDLTGSSIKASLIESTLNSGTGVTLSATNDINVNEALSWNQSLLTLTAGNNININSIMTATGTAALTMATGASGAINMGMNASKTAFTGKINYSASGALTINNDVYTVISNRAGLEAINTDMASLAGKYVLGADIDLSANGGGNWTPIGSGQWDNGSSSYFAFKGHFDGFGHKIDNMTINNSTDSYQGLFGLVQHGIISNISLTNASLTIGGGNYDYGVLVGMANASLSTLNGDSLTSNISIYNTITSGTIAGNGGEMYVGGSIGAISSGSDGEKVSLSNSYSSVTISGNLSEYVGGLVGGVSGQNISITDSGASGDISTTYAYADSFGGFAGYVAGNSSTNSDVLIERVYATGDVSGAVQSVGGLIGHTEYGVTINESYAKGNTIEGSDSVGGLIGSTGSGDSATATTTIKNSFADTTIILPAASGAEYYAIGGLVGEFNWHSVIENSFALGSITLDATGIDNISAAAIGGLVGGAYNGSAINKSYAKVNISMTMAALDNANGDIGLWGIGGFAGVSEERITNSASLGNVTITTGAISNSSYLLAGGFIGYMDSSGDDPTIDNNFASGFVNVTSGSVSGDSFKNSSGFIGAYLANNNIGAQATKDNSTITNNKSATADNEATVGAIGTTSQATYGANGLGFDFTSNGVWAHDSAKNNGLPYLKWAADMFGGGGSTPAPSPTPSPTPPSNNNQNQTVDNTVSKIADNVAKSVENVKVAEQTSPVNFANTVSTAQPAPSVARLVETPSSGTATSSSNPNGGAISSVGGATQIALAVSADANPFSGNTSIAVLDGGVKLASVEMPTNSNVASDAKTTAPVLASIVATTPMVVKQLATQKGIELTMMTPSVGATGENKLVANVANSTTAGGFSFAVKEAVALTVNPKDILTVKATLDDGKILPSWLKFDAQTQTFKAVNPPADALPISTKITVTAKSGSSQQIVVDITK